MNEEIAAHRAQRDQVAGLFRARPHEIITWQELEQLVGRNYQQRVSEARLELDMRIENVPRWITKGGRRKRATGDYQYRPEALGREAAREAPAPPTDGTMFDLHRRPWQR